MNALAPADILNMNGYVTSSASCLAYPSTSQNVLDEGATEIEVQVHMLAWSLARQSYVRETAAQMAQLASGVAQLQADVEQLQANMQANTARLEMGMAALSHEINAVLDILEAGQGDAQLAPFEDVYPRLNHQNCNAVRGIQLLLCTDKLLNLCASQDDAEMVVSWCDGCLTCAIASMEAN